MLKLTLVALFCFFSHSAFAQSDGVGPVFEWGQINCKNSSESLSIRRSDKSQLSFHIKGQISFVENIDCLVPHPSQPFFSCSRYLGSESLRLYSQDLSEMGFIEDQYWEFKEQKLFVVRLSRYYASPSGEFKNVKREWRFLKTDCEILP
jgi:hypothetical protein